GTVGGSQGYELDASSTNFDGTGTIYSSNTASGSLASLNVPTRRSSDLNTTYFLKIGSIWNSATTYALTNPISTSTLASLLSASQVALVTSDTIKANWGAFASGQGANTGEGYELDVSTSSNFAPLAGSSITTSVALSTLTIKTLTPYTTYYVRMGAINYNNVPNFVVIGTTLTNPGAAPSPATIAAVYLSSITVTYGTVGGS